MTNQLALQLYDSDYKISYLTEKLWDGLQWKPRCVLLNDVSFSKN